MAEVVPSALFLLCTTTLSLGSATSIGVHGDPSCPCSSDKEGANDVFVVNATSDLNVLYPLNRSYGIGCGQHDADAGPINSCQGDNPPRYCIDQWCYVSPVDCSLASEPSLYRLGRFYSYATCGFIDKYQSYRLASALRGQTLKIVNLHNSGGWMGSYCPIGGDCYGTVSDFFDEVLVSAGVNVDVVRTFHGGKLSGYEDPYPSLVLNQVYIDNPSQSSLFTACCYAAGMGYVDLCIGSFSMTAKRLLLSEMINVYDEPVLLVSKVYEEEESFITLVGKAFKPFRNELWAGIFGYISLLSLIICLFERTKGGMYASHSIAQSFVASIFTGVKSFVHCGSEFEPVSIGGRVSGLALGFFLLLTISAYTANLATILIVKSRAVADISSFDDILANRNYKVCFVANMVVDMKTKMGLPEDQHRVTGGSRSDTLKGLDSGDCIAAAVVKEDLEQARKDGDYCNFMQIGQSPLFHSKRGVPASTRVKRALEYHTRSLQMSGVWTEIRRAHRPADTCKKREEFEDEHAENEGMRLVEMAGPIFISLCVCVLGIVVDLNAKLAKRCCESNSQQEPPSRDADLSSASASTAQSPTSAAQSPTSADTPQAEAAQVGFASPLSDADLRTLVETFCEAAMRSKGQDDGHPEGADLKKFAL